MADVLNVIGGADRPAHDGRTLDLVEPRTATVAGRSALSGAVDVDQACRAALSAYHDWSRGTPADRQRALLGLADLLEQDADALAAAEIAQTGKPADLFRRDELPAITDTMRFFAGAARAMPATAAGEYAEGFTSMLRREPIGVCAQLVPWNYPLMMAVWKIAPALAAGNTVVLKPAETTPASAVLLARLASEVLPPGVVNVVCGDRHTGAALVEHPIPRLVALTGGVRAGREVGATAGRLLKRTHLELGGNAPVIVWDDVDPQETAAALAAVAFYNAGQDCTAPARLLIHARIHDRFAEAFCTAAATLRPGVDYGPLNNAAHFAMVSALVAKLPPHAEAALPGGPTGGDTTGGRP